MDRKKQIRQLERMFEVGLVSKAAIIERIEIIETQFPDCDMAKYREDLETYGILKDKDRTFQYI